MNYKAKSSGMSAPELHDAELIGIRHDEKDGTVELAFRKPDGQSAKILLIGVVQFRCTDFGLQNVVFQLVVTGANEAVSGDEIRSHVAWMSTADNKEELASGAEIEAVVKLVKTDKLLLVVLTPSWGAQVVATAKDIFWF